MNDDDLILCLDTLHVERALGGKGTFLFDSDPACLDTLSQRVDGRDARVYLPRYRLRESSPGRPYLGAYFTPISSWVLPHADGQYLWETKERRLGQWTHLPVQNHDASILRMASGSAFRLCRDEWDLGAIGMSTRFVFRGFYVPHVHKVVALYTLDLSGTNTGGRARRNEYGWAGHELREQNALLESATRDVAQRLIDAHPGLPKLGCAPC